MRARISTNEQDFLSTYNLDKAEGYWHPFHDRPEVAVDAFRRDWDVPVKNHVLLFHSVAGLPSLAGALRRLAEAIEGEDPERAGQLRKQSLRHAKRAVWLARFSPIEYPQAMRELSLPYADLGRKRKAFQAAQKSCAVAKRQQATYEYARSLLLQATLAAELGDPKANDQFRTAEADLARFHTMIRDASSM